MHSLGKQNHFNQIFQNKKEKYTYLVPSDQAWRNLHQSFATVHKILFMGDFAYQVGTRRSGTPLMMAFANLCIGTSLEPNSRLSCVVY